MSDIDKSRLPTSLTQPGNISGTVDDDISVTLTSPGSSPALEVETINGTAFLVLVRPLDREGLDGPASLSTSVLCQRLNTQDPGFLIPLSVRWVLPCPAL